MIMPAVSLPIIQPFLRRPINLTLVNPNHEYFHRPYLYMTRTVLSILYAPPMTMTCFSSSLQADDISIASAMRTTDLLNSAHILLVFLHESVLSRHKHQHSHFYHGERRLVCIILFSPSEYPKIID